MSNTPPKLPPTPPSFMPNTRAGRNEAPPPPPKDWSGPITSIALTMLDKDREITRIKDEIEQLRSRLTQLGMALEQSHKLHFEKNEELSKKIAELVELRAPKENHGLPSTDKAVDTNGAILSAEKVQ